jgi:hypothetical protein
MCRRDDGWHALVQRLHDLIGRHDDDAATVQGLTVVLPVIPETGEGEHVAVPHTYVMRDLVAVDHLPLIETVRGDQTAAMLERVPVGRLFGDGLYPGVDRGVLGLGYLGPTRHQSPFGQDQFRAGFGVPDDGDVLGGRDVEPGFQAERFRVFQVEGFPDSDLRGVECESAAHERILLPLGLAGKKDSCIS